MGFSLYSKLSFLVVVIFIFHNYSSECCIEKERLALLEIKQLFSSASSPPKHNLLPSWVAGGDEDCCLWEKVTCDRSKRHVTALSLAAVIDPDCECIWSINPTIKPWSLNLSIVRDFKELKSLDLSTNCIGGLAQDEDLCNLSNLKKLDLSMNPRVGRIPTCINKLTSLRELYILYNQVTGNIPSGLCELKNLKLLILGGNELNGTLPSCMGNLVSLEQLDVTSNQLSGEMPSGLCELKNLQGLNLNGNLFNGTVPTCIGKLASIQQLELTKNQFTGRIPSGICELKNLQTLYLDQNNFDGNIPNCIEELTSLQGFDLSSNNFSGEVPTQLFKRWKNFEYISLSNNNLSGLVFPKFMSLPQLGTLNLDHNRFNGTIEESLLRSSNLIELDISNNQVSGEIPSWMGTFKKLELLSLEENKLHGQIPSALCNLSSLLYLDLSRNGFHGNIPTCNGTLASLKYFHLQNNHIVGHIPQEISTFSSLVSLQLQSNQLIGGIPVWINRLSNLIVLQLSYNRLQGELPDQLCSLLELNVMDVSNNQISGTIPPCLKDVSFGLNISQVNDAVGSDIVLITKDRYSQYIGEITFQMSALDLSGNQLSGNIPSELGDLKQLHGLNLSRNNLSGFIPKSFSNLESIESLDLSYNNLRGAIPSELVNLNFLAVFNVSYNNLSGSVPTTGQFGNFDIYNYEENPFLHGYVLCRGCGVSEPPIASFGEEDEEEWPIFDWGVFFWSFGASYITFLLAFVVVLYANPHWRRAWFVFIDYHMLGWFYRFFFNVFCQTVRHFNVKHFLLSQWKKLYLHDHFILLPFKTTYQS